MHDTLLLVRATCAIYKDALTLSARALGKHFWVIALVPAYSLLLNLTATIAGRLGFAGGFLLGFTVAACASSFLAVIEQCMRNERLRVESLGPTFGRYLWSVINIFFIFWIIQLLLGAITATNPALAWLAVAVNAGIFILCNPVPELIYQSQRDGLALVDEAITFVRQNTVEWLLPVAVVLAPLFALQARLGILAMASLGPMNALAYAMVALGRLIPASGGVSQLVLLVVASAAIVYVMLFRGFLYRALSRSGRRQRIFDARRRGL
jgi:hypothetical protein